MYTPKFNQVSDRALLIEAMRAYSFAILFGPRDSQADQEMRATHLPLLVRDEGEHGTLLGHFARANTHWADLSGRETLVVFPGPHTYVSPTFYTEPLSVPTWNYIAIHACGRLALIEEDAGKLALVEELIQAHEPAYLNQWRAMPQGYRRTMLAGIMGFRIAISRIEGKFKISQNRAPEERRAIQSAHAAGTDDQRELARWMERLGIAASETFSRSSPLPRPVNAVVAPEAQPAFATGFSGTKYEAPLNERARRDDAVPPSHNFDPRKQES